MIVGTAGHIDHGKTTLVRALTGVDTDRLKEEKARGISIELGYAYTPLANGDVLGYIDVPGHEKLVHTMAAGACGIDFALLVIAADDGVMPQTREHLAILQLLGVQAGAIALTKCDRVGAERVAQVTDEIRAWLATTMLANAPVFETNAMQPGDAGVARLDAYVRERAIAWHARRDDGLFRLAVDRVFTLTGQGTVVTGTVFAGRVSVGDALTLTPAGLPVRVRSIHAQNRATEHGHAGQRCALNLAGIDKDQITRGDWIVDARLAQTSPRIDVELQLLDDGGVTLQHWSPLHVHLGTTHRVANVALLEGETLAPGQSGRVQLVFDAPVAALPGDRFIVRNAQASRTIGGGRVLDPFGPARRRRTPERRAWLDALRVWLDEARIEPLIEQAPRGLARATLMQLTGLPSDALALPDDAIAIAPQGRAEDGMVIARNNWERLRSGIVDALTGFHARSPDEQGPDVARLRRIAAPLAGDAVWRAAIDALVAEGRVVRSGPWLHLPSHSVSLDAKEEALAAALRPLIAAGRFDPPWVRDLARETRQPEDSVRALLRKLARLGGVYQVVRDLFYDPDVVRELARVVERIAREQGGAVGAAAFRDATGLGRKRAIQILEFFDRVGYTRFQRDLHLLRTDTRLHELL
ncbi:selenocysteine-specific translation elongation factor [Paraburkholderia caballeronis]|uniref:Selenocysteine-specific elongation factor n=1 Tax=Paraburkholderia caballeronis TaxID=416943 RepID=A0A1H7VWB4_9BURK|nr:selenocysteine-specific translation elongation factor [Paraburkholderia caballeronis]PXW14652.1 selenocysteine-specific translation elongation factor SelB [Paraburkholderia caballeronis]PXW93480.1 selenocysteine-specific translation elongation factor SelB [Paraburkholderia caballeronis]RAJ88339.1 selenocysteine-specific translation elongation factor SelB [Paraburkholderia caballeronis]SEE22651.1 selenocysteine-specific translation elongation factor SelB [Paraburkholderia caballeronis]SEM133